MQGVPFCRLADGSTEGCVKDNVAGTYLHGLFDTGELTEKLVQLLCSRKGISLPVRRCSPCRSTGSSSLTCWPTACAEHWT